MKIEDKQLLLRDLCARLPYGVICKDTNINVTGTLSQIGLHYDMCVLDKDNGDSESCYILNCKPYLFPLLSMTEEQLFEVQEILGKNEIKIEDSFLRIVDSDRNTISYLEILALFEWFNKNHFDYRGLIPMGLANDATNKNIY